MKNKVTHIRKFAIAALIVLTVAACSAHKSTDTDSTAVTTDNSGKTATVQTSSGTVSVTQGSADSSKLGVPVYPGATQSQGGVSYSGAYGSGQATALVTSDGFDKVYGWYKDKLPAGSEKMKVSNGDSSAAEFVVASSDQGTNQTTVSISARGNQTAIVVTKGTAK